MTTIQTQIQAHIQSFAQELEQLVRQAALAAVGDALGTAPKTTVARGPVKKATPKKALKPTPKSAMPVAIKAATQTPTKATTKVGRRTARTPKAIGAAAETILNHIKHHPGQRSEEVRAAVGIEKRMWIPAIGQLIEQKKILKKGEKRATTFIAR